jgi:hypothetical protein
MLFLNHLLAYPLMNGDPSLTASPKWLLGLNLGVCSPEVLLHDETLEDG